MVRGWAVVVVGALSTLLALWAAGASADMFDSIGRALDRLNLFEGMEISGHGDFSLRQDFTQGSREAYESQFWNTNLLQATTSFEISGPIWKNFGIRAHIANSGYGYSDNRLMLGWQDKHTALLWGDLNIRLAGNEFASFTKSLRGWQLDQRIGPHVLLRTFQSKEKGLVRRQTFPGNNTSGPYFLTFTPIVDGTELVKVDEQPMRFGEDYILDYDTGQLYFEPPGKPRRIIPSTSTISVSYQSATAYEAGGETRGAQIETLLFGERLEMTLTRLEHNSPGKAADTARFQDDIFQGAGSTGPFDVRFSPILADGAKAIINGKETIIRDALVVMEDNVVRREGVDYDAIRQIGRIIFRRIVPPTSVVRIKYYYQVGPSETGYGDSAVTGLALRHRISDNLSWDMAFAHSDAMSGLPGGKALSTSTRYSSGSKFDVNLQFRSIDPTYRYVDTIGFFRNEQGINAAVGWRPNRNIQFAHSYSNVKTNSGYSYGYSGYSGYYSGGYDDYYGREWTTTEDELPRALDVRAVRHDTNLSVAFPGWPSLRLSRQSMENRGGSRGDSLLESLNISLDYSGQKTPLSFHAGWIATRQHYAGRPDRDDQDPFSTPQSSDTQSISLAASWLPSDRLGLAANWNRNRSRSAYKSQRGDSSSYQVSARWQPMDRLNINLDWTQTESLGAVTSGFYGGGIGFGGYSPGMRGGWSGSIGGHLFGTGHDAVFAPIGGGGGSSDDDEPELSQYRDSQARLGISFQPSSSLSLDANLGMRKYTSGGAVGYLADSDQRYGNLSISWLPNEEMAFTLSVGSDLLQFLEPGRGGVLNNSLTFSGTYRPRDSRWTYGLSVNRQWGVSPNYTGFGDNEVAELVDTSLFDVMANVEYRLAERARVVGRFGMSDFKGGFADFLKNTAEIGLQYQLSDRVGLNFGWQFIRNDSRLPKSGGSQTPGYRLQGDDYTTNLLVLSISTNFQSTLAQSREREAGLNRPVRPGYGTFGSYTGGYGSGYGGGFMGGLDLERKSSTASEFFTGAYSTPLAGAGFSNPYGGIGQFGRAGFSSFAGEYTGRSYYPSRSFGRSGYYGRGSFGSGSFGAGFSGGGYYGGSSWGSTYYGGLSGGFGGFDEEFPGYGGAGPAYQPYGRPYMGAAGAGTEGGWGYDEYYEYGGPTGYPGAWGGAYPRDSAGTVGGRSLSEPAIGDPWSTGDKEYPIDDMRDV